ncbi:coagulation factor XIII A chain-like [Brachionichthys hirsutus]|uniref:coagulation factor XIII A chain-like n=1 Tax=Brachionichthys hirsutus TaxID=412623 RepID=UPI0036053736
MSRPAGWSTRGRFISPVPTTNLVNDDKFPEFEPFEEEATPRGWGPVGDPLLVKEVDMCQKTNKLDHLTGDYDVDNLVVRRGRAFSLKVSFNRPPTPEDDFQLEFTIGARPSASKRTLEVVTFGSRRGGSWSGKILETRGQTLMLEVKTLPDAVVGKLHTYVSIVMPNGMQRTKRNPASDLYLLFNAWCEDDTVFLPEEDERKEFVLNDAGMIFCGTDENVLKRNWMYGQFERGVLDACIHILDSSLMPISDRGSIIKVIRKGSAMMNSQDDDGVLVGNWSDDFSLGTPPTAWTGSVRILLQYANTGVPVCFAQCWVFAGVFNTFLRCLGIPARVVTNFHSAHDNTGNLKTDLIFKPNGTLDRLRTKDSIWNYHCWNEVCIRRPDLPMGFGGWQVVDATPQENSGGYFRCGPASVAAIKTGLIYHPFDCGFVFAEVNSDIVYHIRDKYGTLSAYKVDSTYVGRSIWTKAIGSTDPMDITQNYKNPEGSDADSQAMAQAEELDCARDHSILADARLLVTVSAEQALVGHDVYVVVDFQNQADFSRTIDAHLSGTVVFYTGVSVNQFKDQDFTVSVPPYQTERVPLTITADEYLPHLGSQVSMQLVVTGHTDGQSVSAIKVVELLCPELTLTVSGWPKVRQTMFVTVSFTNPLSFPLRDVTLAIEGPGLMSHTTRFYSLVASQATIEWKQPFVPRLTGNRCLAALMDSPALKQVSGYACVNISP